MKKLKITLLSKATLTFLSLLLIIMAIAHAASVPYTFNSGTTAKSSEMNDNLSYLAERVWEKSSDNLYYNAGNIGIGVTDPTYKLHVMSTQNSDGLVVSNGDSLVASIVYSGSTTAGELNLMYKGSENIHISSNGSSYFNGGNIGIGTSDPQGSLDVYGSIYQRGSQLYADYVFEPAYRLESIEEHRDYMLREKHLKAVPKAKKDSKGREIIEYGGHLKGMLEELEKAHIYISDLNELIKEQQKAITLLQKEIRELKTESLN